MRDARVLVVDDSAAMRALFCDLLEGAKNIEVVGAAANADEARDKIAELKPNVLTLDVEMPGMSGMEFLEEIMTERPMPVVMLSSLTQKGADTSLKAYEIGAVECFPKPLKVSPDQFSKIVAKLGKVVHTAANSNVRTTPRGGGEAEAAPVEAGEFAWNGRLVAMTANMGGIDALGDILKRYPANCPATIIVLRTEKEMAEAFIARLDGQMGCSVKAAEDGALLEEGTIHIAADPSRHVIVEPGDTPKLRLLDREPVEGARPSANLLYGMLAKANIPTLGVVLSGIGEDGVKGLKLLRDNGHVTQVQSPQSAIVGELPKAALDIGAADQGLSEGELAEAILAGCNKA